MTEADQSQQRLPIALGSRVVLALIGPIGVRWAITAAGEAQR